MPLDPQVQNLPAIDCRGDFRQFETPEPFLLGILRPQVYGLAQRQAPLRGDFRFNIIATDTGSARPRLRTRPRPRRRVTGEIKLKLTIH